jgi:hypothetical protein
MQSLPDEVLLLIGQHLQPQDLGQLAKSAKRFMRLAQDEQLFSRLYHRDFISLINDKPLDLTLALQDVKPHKHSKIRKKLLEMDLAATEAGQLELQRMKNLALEADWKWRNLYITLFLTKLHMLNHMDESSGVGNGRHPRGTEDYQALYYPLFDHEIFHETSMSIKHHHNTSVGLVQGRGPFKFMPMAFRLVGVKLKYFNFMHHIALIDEELGRHDVELEEELGGERIYYNRGPPDSKVILCQEGVAVWNKDQELYKLIYPMLSVRQIFLNCVEENFIKTYETQEMVRDYLQESPVVICQVVDTAVCQRFPQQIYQAILEKLKEAELAVESCELLNGNTLKFMCRRVPNWKYKDGQCIFSDTGYDMVKRERYDVECLEPAVVRLQPHYKDEKDYCTKHDAANYHITRNRQCLRARLRTREYLTYPHKPNLILKDCQLNVGDLKVSVSFKT